MTYPEDISLFLSLDNRDQKAYVQRPMDTGIEAIHWLSNMNFFSPRLFWFLSQLSFQLANIRGHS